MASNNIKKLTPPVKQPKLNRSEWIKELTSLYGDLFSYELLESKPTTSSKITLMCRHHGVIRSWGSWILQGKGCTKCNKENYDPMKKSIFLKHKSNFDEKIINFKEKDIQLLPYSKVSYKCNFHGNIITPERVFLKSKGCYECFKESNDSKSKACNNDFYSYRLAVRKHTEFHWRYNQKYFNHDGVTRGRTTYHIDHEFSVKEGFDNNVPPNIIGHWSNLRLINYKENIKKSSNSMIDLDFLIKKYNFLNSIYRTKNYD